MIRTLLLMLMAGVSLPLCLGGTPAWAAGPARLQLVDTLPPPSAHSHPPAERALKAYLLVYFKDETHALYFATSTDGFTFTDVNSGEPVLLGAAVAEQKGVRDPYIMRGPDNAFYMALTDAHIYGKEAGIRSTQWDRPGEQYGWGNNRALVLMKSNDLIHWTHADVRVDKLFPEYTEIGCAWAPEMIFDKARGQMMVYYTTRIGTGTNHLVYSYSDPAFTTLLTHPQPLFTYPVPKFGAIDGDITEVRGKFHLFYVTEEKPWNIRHAISDQINTGYAYDPKKIDPETVHAEAPTLWRRHGTQTYVLMYDVYGLKPHNMGFSETTDFVHYRDLGHFNDPGSPMKTVDFERPKHGAVMSITTSEMEHLRNYFKAPQP